MGAINPIKLGVGLSIFFSLSYYLQNTFGMGLSEGNWLWGMSLIIAFTVCFLFRADYNTALLVIILNLLFTASLDLVFTYNLVPNSHYTDDSVYACLARLLLKSIFELLPVLLGGFAWRCYSKLKIKHYQA